MIFCRIRLTERVELHAETDMASNAQSSEAMGAIVWFGSRPTRLIG